MAHITMLDIEELRKTKLRPYIDKCLEHRAPDPAFHAMMGHNIDLAEAMFVAWDACFNFGPAFSDFCNKICQLLTHAPQQRAFTRSRRRR
jgi:hypothetical protein